jgi:NADH:ubiquinone reductase (H+-translocating)
MAVVGGRFAVANAPRWGLSGFPGWAVWALFHLGQIVEFENRVLVFVQWLWNYWTQHRAARLIIGRPLTDRGDDNGEPEPQARRMRNS